MDCFSKIQLKRDCIDSENSSIAYKRVNKLLINLLFLSFTLEYNLK